MKKEYSNGEVTVVWQPDLCIHSGKCVIGLPGVFNTKAKPWVNIRAQIQLRSSPSQNLPIRCPDYLSEYGAAGGHRPG
ncbi:MAG: (4Fe-4S)-binding protein [Saprospiraceae bacterium]|nr:(4Fe-4S)-binding protein [Saprospiraceae bacterium]